MFVFVCSVFVMKKVLGCFIVALLIDTIIQGSQGIRQLPISLWTSPLMIHKIAPSVDYNLGVQTIGHLTKWTKFNKSPQGCQRERKSYYKTLGTNVINSPMSPPSMKVFLSFYLLHR